MRKARGRWMLSAWRILQKSALLTVLALFSPLAGAEQDSDLKPVSHPLSTVDTSSPRGTLLGFLANLDVVGDALRRGELDVEGVRAYLRAMKTIDLRSTPHSDAWSVRTERILLLKELLDRIELPPDSEIPGDQQVAGGAIVQWKIPDTEITIVSIGDGIRAGEFLFSAGTVEQLHRLYAHAKHLRRNVSIESWMAKEKSVAPIASLVHVRGASQDITESKCIEFEMQERRRKLAYVAREDTRKMRCLRRL